MGESRQRFPQSFILLRRDKGLIWGCAVAAGQHNSLLIKPKTAQAAIASALSIEFRT
jgi:hypothetical protein